jgi:hypothetical protein
MAKTTDEKTPLQKKQEEVVVSKSVTKDEVLSMYNEGKNLLQIAETVYGFDSEEAVEKVRQIIGCE